MRLFRHSARLATIAALLVGAGALAAAISPAASAASKASTASAAMQEGWVRCAHLSPDAPAMDIYMYPFGDPGHPMILMLTAKSSLNCLKKLLVRMTRIPKAMWWYPVAFLRLSIPNHFHARLAFLAR